MFRLKMLLHHATCSSQGIQCSIFNQSSRVVPGLAYKRQRCLSMVWDNSFLVILSFCSPLDSLKSLVGRSSCLIKWLSHPISGQRCQSSACTGYQNLQLVSASLQRQREVWSTCWSNKIFIWSCAGTFCS